MQKLKHTIDSVLLSDILDDVAIERRRQVTLQADGRFRHTLEEQNMPEPAKLACLVEEFGEVSRIVLTRAGLVTDGDPSIEALYEELLHVAALAVAWMESLRRFS